MVCSSISLSQYLNESESCHVLITCNPYLQKLLLIIKSLLIIFFPLMANPWSSPPSFPVLDSHLICLVVMIMQHCANKTEKFSCRKLPCSFPFKYLLYSSVFLLQSCRRFLLHKTYLQCKQLELRKVMFFVMSDFGIGGY